MVDFLCGYIPWMSFLGCLEDDPATPPPDAAAALVGGEAEEDDLLLFRDNRNKLIPAAADAAEDAAAATATATATATDAMPLRNLTDATTTFVSTVSSLVRSLTVTVPRGRGGWSDLGRSVGGAAREYAGVVGTFVLKADVWHAALVVGLLLLITAKLW